MKELLAALIAAKKEFKPVLKDSVNPHYRNKYASLSAILEAVEQPLLDRGLVVIQLIQADDTGTVLITRLFHESGQSIESKYPLPQVGDIQKMGSAITYAKRYSISALLSVVGEEDDDAESLRQAPTQKKSDITNRFSAADQEKTSRVRSAREAAGLSQEQVVEILRTRFGVERPQQLTTEQVDQLVKTIQATAASTANKAFQ